MRKLYLIPFIFLLFSCHSIKNSVKHKSSSVNLYTILYSSNYQDKYDESNIVIQDRAALKVLYASVGKEDFPEINFVNNQVVALFLETKKSSGYSISIKRVKENNDQIILYKKEKIPKPGESVTMALTNPYIIIEIHSRKKIVFK